MPSYDVLMIKEFDAWNIEKKRVHALKPVPYFYEREIWWCALGVNVGDEEDGKHEKFERPVLIFRMFNKHLIWIIPLTTKHRAGAYYYSWCYDGAVYAAMLSQLRLVSTKRLRRKIYMLPGECFRVIRDKTRALI
ncbi:MAG: type II toxin-antitoxin system PemK/MazF family toxin [Candidatus Liptonbacteria bacterium]